MWKLLGQGLNLSFGYNLHLNCGSARFLTHSSIAEFPIFLIFIFSCMMQWLDVGSQFPDQGLNPGFSSESAKS